MFEQNILITGGAGYIGSHCALVLLENDYEVVVLDDCSNAFAGINYSFLIRVIFFVNFCSIKYFIDLEVFHRP